MSDDESIESIEIEEIKGSKEYLETPTVSEENVFSSDDESIDFNSLMKEGINIDLEVKLKRQAQKKARRQKRLEQIKSDPERDAEEKAKNKARDQKRRKQIKSDPKRDAEEKAKQKARDQKRREQIKSDPERDAKEKAKQKARDQKRKSKAKRDKKDATLSQKSSEFSTPLNSDKKRKRTHGETTRVTNPKSSSQRSKIG